MMQDLVGELRSAAEQLVRGTDAGREQATLEFQRAARAMRAAQPPLLLPHRSAPAPMRFGYIIDVSVTGAELPSMLSRMHAAAEEPTWFFIIGSGSLAPIDGARAANLSGVSEAHAVRGIAQLDLDVLVDVGGAALSAMPILVALHPARALVEPLFFPDSHTLADASDLRGAAALVAAAWLAEHADIPSLPVGVQPAELGVQLDAAIRIHRSGALDAARDGYAAVLARYPDHPVALYLLGQLLHAQGSAEQAIVSFRRASAAAPEFRDVHYALAQRYAERNEWDAAALAYRHVVELTPRFAPGWSGLGLALLRASTPDEVGAIGSLERATTLEPDSAAWRFNLGTAYQQAGRLASAREAYEAALARNPADHAALFNLGSVLQEQGDYAAAIAAYRQVLDADPDFALAYPELGTCLQLTGQVEGWRDNFRRYRGHCAPSLPMAVYGLEASMADGDPAAHARWRDVILDRRSPAADAAEFVRCWEQLLFLLLHVDVDRATLRHWYERYDEAASRHYGPRLQLPAARQPGPVRIGYLSGDFRDHVMGRMIFEWVSRHDRSRYAVTLYSLSATQDAWTDRFRALAVSWVDLAGSSLDEASRRIADDAIDVLIDCSGHTGGARPGILARKPARIQATHIATPGPVGLRAIDYKLTDALAEADDAQRFVLERLLPVPGGVFPWHTYDATRHAAAFARSAGKFICGAFVSLMKLSPRCLDLWRRLLQAVPAAVLAFSPAQESWRESYRRWLAAHGIDAARITFIPYAADEAGRLARYRQLDVALDPLPCGNVNGTMEALSMGVPVVTLAGVRHGERLGNALLTRFGITDTIARSEDEYVDLVARIANDSAFAADLRRRIEGLRADSPALDAEAQVRNVEATYERMLSDHSIAIATASDSA